MHEAWCKLLCRTCAQRAIGVTGLAGLLEVAKQLHRLGQAQLGGRPLNARPMSLMGTGAHSGGPFLRGGWVNRPSACASNPCYLCVAAALSASKALAFGGPRPPLPRSPGCGGGAGH